MRRRRRREYGKYTSNKPCEEACNNRALYEDTLVHHIEDSGHRGTWTGSGTTYLPNERVYAHYAPERALYTPRLDPFLGVRGWLGWGERVPRAHCSDQNERNFDDQ